MHTVVRMQVYVQSRDVEGAAGPADARYGSRGARDSGNLRLEWQACGDLGMVALAGEPCEVEFAVSHS